ncbi:MAG: sugar phosphate isomerase/epimerase [Acidobacteriota bacterium]|nr:sugar phosphate isomerase/epimerase [Acidobacteriota bacterium]
MKDSHHVSRRRFLQEAALFVPALSMLRRREGAFLTEIGVCTRLANVAVLAAGGCAYVEEGVRSFLVPEEPEEKFAAMLASLREAPLPALVCNGFLPGRLKAVGPEAKPEDVLAYAGISFRRAARAGVGTIVWGSGESRKIPDGWAKAKAEEQFRDLARRTATLAASSGIILALETLHRGETNFINNLKEGAAMVDAVGHPNFRLLADFYHLLQEGETPDDVVACGRRLHHCHIAEKERRTPPGTAGDDFRPFLKALRKIGYGGRLSLEGRWDDLPGQVGPAVAALKKQIAEA